MSGVNMDPPEADSTQITKNSQSSPEGSTASPSSNEEDIVEKKKEQDLLPIPPTVPKSGISILAHKLWIGNLDKRLNEYLFKTGPDRPEQREYVFVEYSTREEAERAKSALDGKKALGKRIIVDWAKQDQAAVKKNPYSVSETWDVSSVSETLDRTASTSAKIAALEAKLKQMEDGCGPPKKQRTFSTLKQAQRKSKINLIHRPSRRYQSSISSQST